MYFNCAPIYSSCTSIAWSTDGSGNPRRRLPHRTGGGACAADQTAIFTRGLRAIPRLRTPFSGLCAGTCSTSNPPGAVISGYSDYQGNFNFQIATTLVDSLKNILATSPEPPGSWIFSYTVGYPDLIFASNPGGWTLVGGTDSGVDTGHGSNFYDH